MGDIHQKHSKPEYNAVYWVNSDKDTKMVACVTCGQKMPYNPQTHTNVIDLEKM